jgi:hypothetical protein
MAVIGPYGVVDAIVVGVDGTSVVVSDDVRVTRARFAAIVNRIACAALWLEGSANTAEPSSIIRVGK